AKDGKELGKDRKEHDKDRKDSPRGGMHTGGGALTAVNGDDWDTKKDPKHDEETRKDRDHDKVWQSDHDKDWQSGHDKPRGGMHTGGGALAAPGVTAGGLAALAVAGTGMYALRRKKASEGAV
ncbi:hypothetical protein, partial [Streptomyces sp. NPDC002845]